MTRILVLTGYACAGKSTLADAMVAASPSTTKRFSPSIELRKRFFRIMGAGPGQGGRDHRQALIDFAEAVKGEHGETFFIEETVKSMLDDGDWEVAVVEGVRFDAEVDYLIREFGRDAVHVMWLDVDPDVCRERHIRKYARPHPLDVESQRHTETALSSDRIDSVLPPHLLDLADPDRGVDLEGQSEAGEGR